jgi:hypothetical protein
MSPWSRSRLAMQFFAVMTAGATVTGCRSADIAPRLSPQVAPSQQQLDPDLLDLDKLRRGDSTIHI